MMRIPTGTGRGFVADAALNAVPPAIALTATRFLVSLLSLQFCRNTHLTIRRRRGS